MSNLTDTARRLSDERQDLAFPTYLYDCSGRADLAPARILSPRLWQKRLDAPLMLGMLAIFLGAQYFMG